MIRKMFLEKIETRNCPHLSFREAYNGLSFFLNEYPFMNDIQKQDIGKLIESFSKPQKLKNVIRPGMVCEMINGVISITPKFTEEL